MNPIDEVEFYWGEHEWHQKKIRYQKMFVCYQCIYDPCIQHFIKKNAIKRQCDFCQSKCSALDLLSIILLIHEAIYEFYSDTSSELVYPDSEDGWPSISFDTYDLLSEGMEDIITENSILLKEIIDSLPDQMWCRKDITHLEPCEALKYSWREFCDRVKYKTRYVFFNIVENINVGDNIIPCSEILQTLEEIIISTGLVKTLKRNLILYRAREREEGTFYSSSKDLGPPNSDNALQNRMSPLGIPMFYGSNNSETAQLEIGASHGSVGIFKLLKDVKVIDFSNLPHVPSIFDTKQWPKLHVIKFLHHFVANITEPVKNIKDRSIHLEYIPTQIMTEYFRYLFSEKIIGIKFPSSYRQGTNYALFITNEYVVDINGKYSENSLIQLKDCIHY